MRRFGAARSDRGFTLIELIISIALISMIVMISGEIFVYAFNILGRAARKKTDSMKAASGIELTTDDTASDDFPVTEHVGDFTINFGSDPVSVDGTYVEGSGPDGDVVYKSFIPNP